MKRPTPNPIAATKSSPANAVRMTLATGVAATAAQQPDDTPRTPRARGQHLMARALWYISPEKADIRTERLGATSPHDVRIATRYSAFSRGTERLVANGDVPGDEAQRMRAPYQQGDFPFPVKYGYSAAGTIVAGPEAMLGQTAFCLHPHQDFFQVPADRVVLTGDIPARRATLAANMETALNAHWDAGTTAGDRVAVIGGGVVGLLVAYLATRLSAARVTLVDCDPARQALATALGFAFAMPDACPNDNRVVFHTSATSAGLQTAVNAADFEGRIVELSWYGTKSVNVELGSAFHSRRLKIVSSQVGHVAPSMRATVSRHQRLTMAVALLNDARLDALVSNDIAFNDVPRQLSAILGTNVQGLPPVIRYGDKESET